MCALLLASHSLQEHVYLHEHSPAFPEASYDVVKQDLFQRKSGKTDLFYCLELHAATDSKGGAYRIFTHSGSPADLDEGGSGGDKKFRIAETFEQAEDLYVALCVFSTLHFIFHMPFFFCRVLFYDP